MDLRHDEPDPTDPRRLQVEGERTCDRLRTLTPARLTRSLPGDGATAAQLALRQAQVLADRAADLAGRRRRVLPELPETAAGDVLAVCCHDLVAELRAVPDLAVCRASVAELVALRRRL